MAYQMLDSIIQDVLNKQIQEMNNFLNVPDLEVSDQHFYMRDDLDQQKNGDTGKPVKKERNIVQLKLKHEIF